MCVSQFKGETLVPFLCLRRTVHLQLWLVQKPVLGEIFCFVVAFRKAEFEKLHVHKSLKL